MVNLSEIANKCGVSISTVSLALHKPQKISKIQKEKILKVAHELGYLTKKRPAFSSVLLVFNGFYGTYFGEYYNTVIFGILDTLAREKVSCQILDQFAVEYGDIYEQSGIIFVGKPQPEHIAKAQEFKIPFVLCGHPLQNQQVSSLRFDIERGTEELLEYVVSCGHKNIGLILAKTEEQDVIRQALLATYKKVLDFEKISFRQSLIAEAKYDNLQTIEVALNKLLRGKTKPTAIFCSNDHFAYLTYRILKKWKIKIPQEISIVGFDGILTPFHLEAPQPVLTTVETDQINLGRESVELLKKIIQKPNQPEQQLILPVRLRIGDSVQRI